MPYINLLGKETILNAPCWKTEAIGDTVAIQLTETIFEDISSELRERVVEYFEEYDRKKKLVPEFPIREFFGKNLPEEFEHGL